MVVLRSFRDAHGSRHLDATLEPDGALRIEGHDLGVVVESAWGSGMREYAWTWRVASSDVAALVERLTRALEAPPDLEILPLLFLLYDERSPGRIEDFIGPGEGMVPAEFWSRVGD